MTLAGVRVHVHAASAVRVLPVASLQLQEHGQERCGQEPFN